MTFNDMKTGVLRELERIHKRRMAPLKKALELAIVRATKKNCWYDPWNRKGVRADYGILSEPVEAFIREADVQDIQLMIEYLLEKARRQIEHSDDEGDCAGQARYWVQKLVKAAVKKNGDLIDLIDWAMGIIPKDPYFLTDAEAIVLEKNKVPSPEKWEEVAKHYKDTERRVYLIALKKAGKIEEQRRAIRTAAKLKKEYSCLVEDALLDGACAKALEICERGLSDSGLDRAKAETLKATLAHLEVAEGQFDREFALRRQAFEREQSVASYESLMELAMITGSVDRLRRDALTFLETSKKWTVLAQIALREYRLKDAVGYYWRGEEQSAHRRYGCDPYKLEFDLSDRLARLMPGEAVKILVHIVEESLAAYMQDYASVHRALTSIKPNLYVLGRASEWTLLLESLRSRHPKKRKLIDIIDELTQPPCYLYGHE